MRRSDFGTEHGSPLDIMDRSAITTPSLPFDPAIDRVATLAFSVPFPIAWAIPAHRNVPMLLPESRRRQRRKHGPPGVRQAHAGTRLRDASGRYLPVPSSDEVSVRSSNGDRMRPTRRRPSHMKRRSPEARLPYMTGTFACPGPVSGNGPDRSGLRSACSSVRFVPQSDSAHKTQRSVRDFR